MTKARPDGTPSDSPNRAGSSANSADSSPACADSSPACADGSPACPSCGAEFVGDWCHACGEKRLDRSARGLRPLLGESFTALTDLDGRLWRTLRALFLRPGFLSREYLEGRRRIWIGPASLFVLINVAYFIAPPMSDFNLSLEDQILYQPWGAWAEGLVEARVAERGTSMESYSADYAAESGHVAKSLILFHIPWIAAALALAARRYYFAEHLVVATHGFTFLLAMALALQWIARPLVGLIIRWTGSQSLGPAISQSFLGLLAISVLVYWFLAARRAYGLGWARSTLATTLFVFGLVLGHVTYRWVQFVLTFALS